jgi:hypothetical protein
MHTGAVGADAWGRGAAAARDCRKVANPARAAAVLQLNLLREEFLAKSMADDFRAVWWRTMGVDGRRLFCALAGLDDSVEFSDRLWGSLSLANQLAVSEAARDWARKLEPMRMA